VEYQRPAKAEIDLGAIGRNLQRIKKLTSPKTLFMAVVKADGYGHGALQVAKEALASGADRLGVALPEEGVALRKAGIGGPIHILGEMHPSASSLVMEFDVADVLGSEARRRGRATRVHVKVDTGMNRLGLPVGEVPNFLKYLQRYPLLKVEGIFTHFACADDPESDFTKKQYQKFKELLTRLEGDGYSFPLKHSANSAATIFHDETHLDMVRIGIALYGLHPSDATKGKIDLEPALSLISAVSQIKRISAGEGASYSLTYKAPKDRRLALLPMGYGDGYTRLLSNKAEVLIGNRRFPVVGNICMDQSLVDIGACRDIKTGDEIVLIGKQGTEEISADELAKILGTINYEITCMINKRVPRKYKNS
jgi:alanine racemase